MLVADYEFDCGEIIVFGSWRHSGAARGEIGPRSATWRLTRNDGSRPTARSAAADEGHAVGHDRHLQDVGVGRQFGHVAHRRGHVGDVHERLGTHRAVGLRHAGLHPGGHRRAGIADVNLTDADALGTARAQFGGEYRFWYMIRCMFRYTSG